MKEIVNIKNLDVEYFNVVALKDISLKIYPNEFVGIIGPNGGGKSTLVKTIVGIVKKTKGEITINEKKMGYVPQFSNLDRTFPINAFDMVLTSYLRNGIHPFHKYSVKEKNEVREVLKKLGLYEVRNRQINDLSGGQFQRLLLARALISKPKLLLLDEPTASVDSDSKDIIYKILNDLSKEITIIMVAHDFDLKTININKIVLLDKVLLGDKSL
jgi:zinc transport system ATP-binding protein